MKRWGLFAMSVLVASISLAGDRYVLQAAGPEVMTQNPCTDFMWLSDLYFLNTGSDPVTALPDNVSNGALVQAQPALLPPHQIVQVPFVDYNWYPVPAGLGPFVLHFDLPDGVLIRSRMEPYGSSSPGPCSPIPGNALLIRGGLPIPVFRQLVPAGQVQYFLSSDLGNLNNTSYATVYNAADLPANVSIEVRRYCDGDLISSSALSVPASTALQVPASGDYSSNCFGDGFGRYITVTSDQPGLAIVSVVDDDPFKKISMCILGPDN